jgi:hypothetical protein
LKASRVTKLYSSLMWYRTLLKNKVFSVKKQVRTDYIKIKVTRKKDRTIVKMMVDSPHHHGRMYNGILLRIEVDDDLQQLLSSHSSLEDS